MVALLVASSVVASAGALGNQTSVSVQTSGKEALTLSPRNPAPASTVDLNPQGWVATSPNTYLSSAGGVLAVRADPSAFPSVVVAETVGLRINSTAWPFMRLDYTCPLGLELVVALGWSGWNPVTGPDVVANLSRYPGLFAGLETSSGIIWINTGYPNSAVQCSGNRDTLIVGLSGELSRNDLAPANIGGLQLKVVLPTTGVAGPVLEVESALVDSVPYSYSEVGALEGRANLLLGGSAVIITPPPGGSAAGYYPKRTMVTYDMSAGSGTMYSVFAYVRLNGTGHIFGSSQAFSHSNSSLRIATTVDFVNGEPQLMPVEPLVSISSVLAEGQIAIIFVPLNSSSFNSVKVESVQTTWGRLPFGSSGFAASEVPPPWTALSVLLMIGLVAALPSLLCFILWRRSTDGRTNSRRAVLIIMVAAAGVRLGLAPWTGSIDTDNFAATASVYFSTGSLVDWVSLPGFLYVQLVSYFPYALLRHFGFADWTVLAHSTYAVETLFVKLPSILADLGVGYLLAAVAKRFRPDLQVPVLILYLINPLTVYVSGVYGQFDPVFVFLLIAGLYGHFVLEKPILTGFLLGAASLVNPVGFAGWIAVLASAAVGRRLRSFATIGWVGTLTFLLGLSPLFLQPNSVLLASIERLGTAIPGDNVVGTVLHYVAFGQSQVSSVGYGLTSRFTLELAGISLGSYFYPVAAGGSFLLLTFLIFRRARSSPTHTALVSFIYCLGVIGLFEFFFPTVYLQFALWPFAILLCLYAMTRDGLYLSLALLDTVLGVLYFILVDKPVERATGIGGEILGNLGLVTSMWAMVGLVYSALMLYLVYTSIRKSGSIGNVP